MLTRQALFEPLEELLDLPSLVVDSGDGERSRIETICEGDANRVPGREKKHGAAVANMAHADFL